jgi:TolB-like protein
MPNKLSRFWKEVKRRNVHRSLAVYAGTSYVIFEASSIIFPRWGLPDWTVDAVLYLLIAGLFITFIISWIYDVTPEGVQKTPTLNEISKDDKRTVSISWKIATYVSLVVIIGLIFYNIVNSNRIRTDLYNLEKSIAVLPFENLSPDLAQLWFAEGISDVISSQLTKIAGYRVTGRKSTVKFRDEEKDIAEIGKELGVNFVIDGAAQKLGDQLRIVIQLIRVSNETYLWSEVYDGDWDEIFEFQTDIANKVASSLQTALVPEETQKIINVGTENPEAWEYYMQGEVLMKNLTEMNIWKAIDKYKQAIDLDDYFAQAYAGLAFAYFELTTWDVPEPDPTLIPVAREWAFKALELNENLGAPNYILGAINYIHDWDWKAAEEAFKMGMELDSSNLLGRTYYANFLTLMRRFKESQSISQYSVKLDPLDPSGYLELSFPFVIQGQWEKAIDLVNRSLEIHPDFWNAKYGLALYYLDEGTNLPYVYDFCEEQLDRFNHDLQGIPSGYLGGIAELLAMAGGREKVEDILDELKSRIDAGSEDTPYFALGLIYNAMAESEKAIDYLEKGVEIKEPFITTINFRPTLEALRSNKRFQDLLIKLGFEV